MLSLWPNEREDVSTGRRCNSVATDGGATEDQWWNDGTEEASGSSFISVLSRSDKETHFLTN